MLSDPHFGYIAAAYGIVAVVVVALIVWIRTDYGIQRRLLKDLEERGVRRRSEQRGDGRA